MSVQYVQGGGGLLSSLGTLASLGGMFIPGAQWLTPLGMGMSAVDGLMSGNSQAAAAIAGQAAKGMINGWKNPAEGTIGNATGFVTKPDSQLMREWSPYDRGVLTWLR